MSDPNPAPLAARPTPKEFVFRSITPVVKYQIDGANCFTHCGSYRGTNFKIRLHSVHPLLGPDMRRFATDGVLQMVREQVIHLPRHFFAEACFFLLSDVTHSAGSVSEATGNSAEALKIHQAALDALRLHSSAGVAYLYTYQFRCPPSNGLGTEEPNSRQSRFSHLSDPSVLRGTDFDACRATIDVLMNQTWKDTTLDKVLWLAMNYHRLSFTFEEVPHAFLILMVVFEALFKKDGEDNASMAAKRTARLIGRTKKECQDIQRDFFDAPADSLCRIRNRIAHGDPGLDNSTVVAKYPCLYRHVTQAIVELLNLPAGTIDGTKDYYDEISRHTEARFVALPTS